MKAISQVEAAAWGDRPPIGKVKLHETENLVVKRNMRERSYEIKQLGFNLRVRHSVPREASEGN